MSNKKNTGYYLRKENALEAFRMSNSAKELEHYLLLSSENDYISNEDNHKDCISRFLMGLGIEESKIISSLDKGKPEDYREDAACSAMMYALKEESYTEHYLGRTPEEQLNYTITIYHSRLTDIKRKAEKRVTVANESNGKPIFATHLSINQSTDEHGDALYNYFVDNDVADVENKISEEEFKKAEVCLLVQLLSPRELICYLLALHFGIKPKQTEKGLKGVTYKQMLINIYNKNRNVYRDLLPLIKRIKNDKVIFKNGNISISFTNAVYNAKKKCRDNGVIAEGTDIYAA